MSLRLRLFASHLGISVLVVACVVSIVLFVWYPRALAQLEGAYPILLMMAGVDICVGPLCTLIVASPAKTRAHLARDLGAIGFLQLVALGYGVHTTFIARPAFVVYNSGEFDIARANEITPLELAKVKDPAYASLPLTGPIYAEARFPDDLQETLRIVNGAINGGPDIKDMPQYFRAWPATGSDALAKARPVVGLPEKSRLRVAARELLNAHGIEEGDAVTLLILGKDHSGTVVIRKSDLSIIGILPTT